LQYTLSDKYKDYYETRKVPSFRKKISPKIRRKPKQPIETPSVIELALQKHLPKKKKIAPKNAPIAPKSVDTPKKVEQKINKDIKRQDISTKGLQSQRNYLLDKIDETLAKFNPEKEKITFEVPGDGTFKILNTEKALNKFKTSVEKNWPKKAEAKFKVPEGYKKKNLPKPSKKAEIRAKADKLAEDGRKVESKLKALINRRYREKHESESFWDWVELASKFKILGRDIKPLVDELKNIVNMHQNLQELWKSAPD